MKNISKKAKPGKKESRTEKKQFWSKKAGEAHKDMKEAKRTNNVGWQKMLKKRLSKYRSHYGESSLPSFQEFFTEATKTPEEYEKFKKDAYEKFVQDAQKANPGWDPERPLTSGGAFKPWQPKGGWPKESEESEESEPKPSKPRTPRPKQESPVEDNEIDIFGDEPIGSYRSEETPSEEKPSETNTDQDLLGQGFILTAKDIAEVFDKDKDLFERLFLKSTSHYEYEDKAIYFGYGSRANKTNIENEVNKILKGDTIAEAKTSKKMKNTCWDGYKPIGTKKMNGKEVPNCVPIKKK